MTTSLPKAKSIARALSDLARQSSRLSLSKERVGLMLMVLKKGSKVAYAQVSFLRDSSTAYHWRLFLRIAFSISPAGYDVLGCCVAALRSCDGGGRDQFPVWAGQKPQKKACWTRFRNDGASRRSQPDAWIVRSTDRAIEPPS